MTAEQSMATQAAQCGSSQGRAILALARTMLDTIVRCQEAVLQDDNETMTVICHVLRQVRAVSSEFNETFRSAKALEGKLKAILGFVVRTHEEAVTERALSGQFAAPILTADGSGNGGEQEGEEAIANWFFWLSQELDSAHPQTAHMLRLRLRGLDSRQIADRLQLPPRLVRHLFHVISTGYVLGEIGVGAVA